MACIVKLSRASHAGLPTLAPQLTFCTLLPSHVVRCMAGTHGRSQNMLCKLAGALRRCGKLEERSSAAAAAALSDGKAAAGYIIL